MCQNSAQFRRPQVKKIMYFSPLVKIYSGEQLGFYLVLGSRLRMSNNSLRVGNREDGAVN